MQKLSYVLVGLLCLPLLFINIKDTHDWGDDFAQYIHQAANITEGKPQGETGYVYNEDMFLGPKAYPVGFPLLLAPVYTFCGNSIKAFTIFISAALFLSCLLMFRFFRYHFSALTSLLLILIIVYNPWVWMFKTEVMSEIPFMLFLLLAVILYTERDKNRYNYILLGITGGFLIAIRNIGFVLLLAILLDTVRQWYLTRKYGPASKVRPLLTKAGIVLGLALFTYFLLSVVLFPQPSGMIAYPRLADTANFGDLLLKNMVYNIAVFEAFFSHYEVNKWDFAIYITRAVMLVFLLVGLIRQICSRINFIDLLVLLYLGAIMVFPYGDAGFRFLLPVAPFFMYYVAIGLSSVNIKLPVGATTAALILSVMVLLQYRTSAFKIIESRHNPVAGPLEPSSLEAWEYIKKNTEPDAVIAFCKPRALALYTGRNGFANSDKYTSEQCKAKFGQAGVSYYLVQKEISDEAIRKFLEDNKASIVPVWNNDKFILYR